MAWFRKNKNDDEYNTYGRTEPGYGRNGYSDHVHRPVIMDSDGRKHPVVGYTATHNAQRYVAKTEQIVRYQNVQGFPAMIDYKYSPPRQEVYKDHGDGDKPHLAPRISTHVDRPDKTSEFSPKARDHEVVHRQNKISPWNNGYRDNSPPSNDQHRTGHHDYGKHNNFNSKTNNKYDDDDDDDEEEDVICNDEVCFENPRKGSKPNYFQDVNYNENEKRKGNGYNLPTYIVPISTQPKRDTYYNNSDKKEKENSYSARKFPFIATQPRSRETIDSTEARRRYGMAMPGAPGTGSGHDEENTPTIDSNEAARKYDGVLLPN